MSDTYEVQHAAPVDAAYMDKFREAIRAEKLKLSNVFRTALMSSGRPAATEQKSDEVIWQELQLMAQSGDPALYQSDPNDPNSAAAWWAKLAPRFGASPVPQQALPFGQGGLLG